MKTFYCPKCHSSKVGCVNTITLYGDEEGEILQSGEMAQMGCNDCDHRFSICVGDGKTYEELFGQE